MFIDYQQLVFIEPDYRFFVDRGHTREERVDFFLSVLVEFGNDLRSISEFINGLRNSDDVAFAVVCGSALNANLEICEIEDVDILIVTRNRKFVHEWNQPSGVEIRYFSLSEIENHLKVGKRFWSRKLSEEYRVLGGIFSNGLLALKFSKELENIVRDVRKNFGKTHLKLLTQMVEYDCKKRVDKPQRFATTNGTIPSQNEKKYAFHGDGHCLSFEEVRAMIKESINRKNIQPKRAQPITRKIMKRMKLKRAHQVKEYTYQWR